MINVETPDENIPLSPERGFDFFVESLGLRPRDIQDPELIDRIRDDPVFDNEIPITGDLPEIIRINRLSRFEVDDLDPPVDAGEDIERPAVSIFFRDERELRRDRLDLVLLEP